MKDDVFAKVESQYVDYGKRARELKNQGQKVIGYICSFVPLEIITAAGCVPFRVRGDILEPITKGDTLMETIVCPFIRSCFDLSVKGKYDFLSGMVKINTIYSSPLIKISNGLMPAWQENVKRLIDIVGSLIAMIILIPVYLVLTIIIKSSGKGAVIYSQERIGKFGKPFVIYKFRSMFSGSENNGPALSGKNDPRITPVGRFMRRTHLDEIPQFYNVVRGDMSLVGPRPERQYYIDRIVKRAPHYTHLLKLRPGMTSWGQVKYGYASNIDQMLERLPYDIIYLKNISLYLDLKILIYTMINVMHGKGK
jgi:lipopolysaccharide/colanic/teichoic acid biosynthesis glycosyltransferase